MRRVRARVLYFRSRSSRSRRRGLSLFLKINYASSFLFFFSFLFSRRLHRYYYTYGLRDDCALPTRDINTTRVRIENRSQIVYTIRIGVATVETVL